MDLHSGRYSTGLFLHALKRLGIYVRVGVVFFCIISILHAVLVTRQKAYTLLQALSLI